MKPWAEAAEGLIYTPQGWEGRSGHSIQPLPSHSGKIPSAPQRSLPPLCLHTTRAGELTLGKGY